MYVITELFTEDNNSIFLIGNVCIITELFIEDNDSKFNIGNTYIILENI